MNCNFKVQSKGLHLKLNFCGLPVLKFLLRPALDFPYIYVCNFSRDFLTIKCIKNITKWSCLLAHVTPLIFFSRILRSEVQFTIHFFFSEQPFYGNYSTLDSYTTNTVISHAVDGLLVKMASKTVTKSITAKLTMHLSCVLQ